MYRENDVVVLQACAIIRMRVREIGLWNGFTEMMSTIAMDTSGVPDAVLHVHIESNIE